MIHTMKKNCQRHHTLFVGALSEAHAIGVLQSDIGGVIAAVGNAKPALMGTAVR